jgi:uncharacterized protein YndB with AHSA1/START domain
MQGNNSLTLEKMYKAPVDKVWKAITDREQLKQWYFDFPEDFKLETGYQFDWHAGPPGGKQWLHRGKMMEIIESKKLVHTWEYPGYSGTSTVIWELIPMDKNTTKLIFTHQFNVPFDTKEEALRRENFAAGWNHIINTGLVEFLKI